MVGDEEWPDNPAHVIGEGPRAFVRMWFAGVAGMGGVATWPDAGGIGDQAAQVVDAFGMLAGLKASAEEAERARKGG